MTARVRPLLVQQLTMRLWLPEKTSAKMDACDRLRRGHTLIDGGKSYFQLVRICA